jgi:hypothetical protein
LPTVKQKMSNTKEAIFSRIILQALNYNLPIARRKNYNTGLIDYKDLYEQAMDMAYSLLNDVFEHFESVHLEGTSVKEASERLLMVANHIVRSIISKTSNFDGWLRYDDEISNLQDMLSDSIIGGFLQLNLN